MRPIPVVSGVGAGCSGVSLLLLSLGLLPVPVRGTRPLAARGGRVVPTPVVLGVVVVVLLVRASAAASTAAALPAVIRDGRPGPCRLHRDAYLTNVVLLALVVLLRRRSLCGRRTLTLTLLLLLLLVRVLGLLLRRCSLVVGVVVVV